MKKILISVAAIAAVSGLYLGGKKLMVEEGPGIAELAANVQPLAAEDALSLTAISQDDLPPEGTRSLFDHVLAEQETIPYPFENLLDALAAYDKDNRRPTSILIPHSRSLLKAQANAAKPRLISAADMQPKQQGDTLAYHFKGRLFLGLVEEADEIEVISYNEEAGRFEYQLVKDYREGGQPKVVYAQRNVCLTCHANQATIFPVRPWAETNAQSDNAEEIKAAGAGDGVTYQGAKIDEVLATAEKIDQMTDIGNVVATAQRVWIDGCDTNVECRQLMLKLALQFAISPGDFSETSADAQRLIALQSATWPSAGVALPNADIPNRDPRNAEESGVSATGKLKQLFKDQDELADFDDLPKLPPRLDPLTPRAHKAIWQANSLDGVYAVAQMFAASDLALLEEKAGYQFAAIAAAAAHPAMQSHYRATPLRRGAVISTLVEALGGGKLKSCCSDVSALSEPVADGEPPLEYAEGSVLKHFDDYCFACHRGNPSARLNFMSGKDEAVVMQKIADTSEIRDVLDYERYAGSSKASKLMPPANSKQRAALEKELAAGNTAPLEEMADAIPSLFDF